MGVPKVLDTYVKVNSALILGLRPLVSFFLIGFPLPEASSLFLTFMYFSLPGRYRHNGILV